MAPLGTRDHQVVAVISLNALADINTLIDALKRGGGKEIPSSIPTSVNRVTDVLQLDFSDCKNSSSFTFLSGNAAAVDPVMLSLDLVRAADMVVFCVGVANDAISGHSELKKSDPIDAVSFENASKLALRESWYISFANNMNRIIYAIFYVVNLNLFFRPVNAL